MEKRPLVTTLLKTTRDKLRSEISPSSAIITDLSWPDSTL